MSVTADGVKTWSQVFDALFALIDGSKINDKSVLEYDAGTTKTVFHVTEVIESHKTYAFARDEANSAVSSVTRANIKASGSTYHVVNSTVGGSIAFADASAYAVNAGRVIKLIY